jgi:hypothetical protein
LTIQKTGRSPRRHEETAPKRQQHYGTQLKVPAPCFTNRNDRFSHVDRPIPRNEMLPWALQSPIIRSEHPPKTLEEWYTKATNFYIGHKRAQCLLKKRDDKPTNIVGVPSAQKKFTFSKKKDPNAMDIDRMTVEE